jgi:pimeloyl-ACP methyl ester carboxylesterase
VARLAGHTGEWEPTSGPNVAQAQLAAFRAWERVDGERFGKLRSIRQPCLVVNGVFDNMMPVRNAYVLGEHLPGAILLTIPTLAMGRCFRGTGRGRNGSAPRSRK